MFKEGNILYFNPFYFSNGTYKPKFFVVLRHCQDGLLLAALPTSQDHIPADMAVRAGCCEHPDKCINVYVFMAGKPVAIHEETGMPFCFEKNTFIYGADLNTYPVIAFKNQFSNRETKIVLKGRMDAWLFEDLKKCLRQSASVRYKYKKVL